MVNVDACAHQERDVVANSEFDFNHAGFYLSQPGDDHVFSVPEPLTIATWARACSALSSGFAVLASHALPAYRRRTMDIRNINEVPAFTTVDGSEIRELLAHRNSRITNQSLAEARLGPGAATTRHYHPVAEEIYYILDGEASMEVDGIVQHVKPGDAIAIPAGAAHQIRNTGTVVLRFLCCCAPGYEHADTVLLE